MSASRLTSVCALLFLAVAVTAGCPGNGQTPSSSALATSSTTVTSIAPTSSSSEGSTAATLGENDRRQVAYASWSPAETIPAIDLTTLTETLTSYGQRMLFPSEFPVTGAGLGSAEFDVYWTPPTSVVEFYVICRAEDGAVDVTLNSCTEYSSIVGWGLETIPDAVEVTVRGLPGRSYPRTDESRPMLYWEEQGQHFVASYRGWAVEPATQQMIDWLDSWYMLP